MKYHEINNKYDEKLTVLMNECGVFWAFNTEQFHKNKTPLKEVEKYVSIGHGGYMPKSKVDDFVKGQADLTKWKKSEIKKEKNGIEEHILYELSNHECFYTGSIEDAMNVLDYPEKEVQKVFNKYREEYANN